MGDNDSAKGLDVRQVDMSAENNIDLPLESLHGGVPATDQAAMQIFLGQPERVVGDQQTQLLLAAFLQAGQDLVNLLSIDAPTRPVEEGRPLPGGVDTNGDVTRCFQSRLQM